MTTFLRHIKAIGYTVAQTVAFCAVVALAGCIFWGLVYTIIQYPLVTAGVFVFVAIALFLIIQVYMGNLEL